MTTAVPQPSVQTDAPAAERAPLAWLTLEVALYALIVLAAAALRWGDAGHYPLSNVEARQALVAQAIYQGDDLPAGSYSPLLASLNTLTFILLNDSDTTARLASVLLGVLLVLLPATLRRQLGQKSCLLVAGLLALSPSAIFLARTNTGETATALGALMMVSGFFNWAKDGRQRWLLLLAGGLAVLLTSGPLAFSVLVVFGVLVALRWSAFKTMTPPADRSQWRSAGIFLAALLLALGTAASLNLSGFGVTTGLFTDWLGRFSFTPRPDAGFNAVFLLTIYEPLLVVAGLVGLAYALLGRDLLRQSFVGWFVGVLLLDLGMAGRPAGSLLLAVVPLAFLGGEALAELWRGLERQGSWGNEGVILAAGLVITVFGYIGLTGWLVRHCDEGNTFCQLAWLQPVVALLLFLVIVTFFAYIARPDAALRGLALTGTAIGVLFALSIGWRLSHGPLERLGFQPLAGVPPSTELVAMSQTLASESLIRSGDNDMLDITVVGELPAAVWWQLRHYKNVQQRGSVLDAPVSTAIITPVITDGDLGLGQAYIGQDFGVDALWSPTGFSTRDLIYWLIFRELPLQPDSDKIILWLRVDSRS